MNVKLTNKEVNILWQSKSNTPKSVPTSKTSSSVNTNSFIKGMNKDITPVYGDLNKAWWNAQ